MTKYTLYRCNLCQEYIQPSDSASKEGFGVLCTNGVLELTRPDVTREHICHQCAQGVHDEMRKVTPAWPA